eukprot:8793211-Pyramimonas_sp.AAC.1
MDGYFASQRLLGNNPEVSDCLSMSMFEATRLRTKAGEARWLLKWCVQDALPKYHKRLTQGKKLMKCARTLQEWDDYLSSLPDVPSPEECQTLRAMCITHLQSLKAAPVKALPKNHAIRRRLQGRPWKGHMNAVMLFRAMLAQETSAGPNVLDTLGFTQRGVMQR